MPALSTIVLFFTAALALLLVPGPAVLYIVTRSIDQGRRAGLASALGVGVANFCHTAAATLGLSALLMSSATLFALVKYAGAAYLITGNLKHYPAVWGATQIVNARGFLTSSQK